MSSAPSRHLAELTRDVIRDVPALGGALPDAELLLRDPAGAPRREVYLLGTIKSGKSTLVNALLGRDVMPRGAGVKTFNLTRARRAEQLCSRVLFHAEAELRERFAFDFRMLGFAFELPDAPYSKEGSEALGALLEEFERACREDERLADVDADAPLLGLLPRSLARIRHGIAGLAELHARWDEAVVEDLRRNGRLEFPEERFDGYLPWTTSTDLAALIRGIEIDLPAAGDPLPANLELIDCQGSDSLNALDFADVESVVQRADAIVYVIQSRLGLRQGDRDLLRHLAQAGAAERLLPVLNVDAFDPLQRAELDALQARVTADLARTVGRELPLIAVAGLAELDAATGDDEELALMASLWTRRDAGAVLARIRAGAGVLRTRLAELARASRPEAEAAQRLRGLLHQCRTVAGAALERDAALLGTDASGMSRAEALAAVQRILDGERQRLREDAAARVTEALAEDGPLQREIDAFLAEQDAKHALRRPVPEALLSERRPQRVVDAALATFNADWLGAEDTLRRQNLAEVRHWLGERLESAYERIARMLPDSARSGALLAEGEGLERPTAADAVRRDPRGAIERVMDPVPVPRLLAPVVLPLAVRQALMALFVSRGLVTRLRRTERLDAASLLARRVETLWRRTLAAGFRQAAEDRPHAMANARENHKFQYCYRIADLFVGVLTAEILGDVERHYAQLARLAAGERLLLTDAARRRVERYLQDLERLEDELPD
ncbi:MAG: dynamin family protein [Pseudomonadales bacterium]|nr:dynamin family protein [Pseudomonadales bacterium]